MSSELRLPVRTTDGAPEFDQHMLTVQQRSTRLHFPQSIKFAGALGRSVALAQFVASWASTDATHSIDTTLPNDQPDRLERFVSRLHGLTATYYADQITGKDGKTNLRSNLLRAARPRISAMSERRFADAARGTMTEFIFVNRARSQFHSAVYRKTPIVADLMDPQRHGELIVSPEEMNALVRNTLRAHNFAPSHFKRLSPLLDDPKLPLGNLLHETFRNTSEHAYLDGTGRIPIKGLRCILISARAMQPQALQPRSLASTDHPNIDGYFETLRNRAGLECRNLVHILEVSVFDTGPGFAATIRPVVDEHIGDAGRVAECFRDHVSSKPGENSGLGLGRILSYIDSLGGFLRIRTSTVEAFFSPRPHAFRSDLAPTVAGDLPAATGTALTIAIPLAL